MNRWPDRRIKRALSLLMEESGHFPTRDDIKSSHYRGLEEAVGRSHRKGYAGWREVLSREVLSREILWTDSRIHSHLRIFTELLGRMPTCTELVDAGRADLMGALCRHPLKVRGWAERMGVEMKESSHTRGYAIEEWVKGRLEDFGLEALLTPTRCPYDLLVEGTLRVEVKMSTYVENTDHGVYGYLFKFGPRPWERGIDYSVLVCCDEDDQPLRTYVVPQRYCRQKTVTITKSDRWKPYLNAWRYIRFGLKE